MKGHVCKMSTVTVLTQWDASTADHDEIVVLAKEVKELFEQYGAKEFSLNVVQTGKNTNQLVSMANFSNWEAHGRCMAALPKDEKYKRVMSGMYDIAELTTRVILTGVPL
jgi:hypothetical protein